MPLSVQVVSPQAVLWSGEADMVLTRTLDGGEIAFMNGHAPFVGALGTGVTRIRPAAGEDRAGADVAVAIHGGFVEVSDNQISILSDVAELADQIDVGRAEAAKERAEAALRHEHDAECESALTRANARLQAAGGSHVTAH